MAEDEGSRSDRAAILARRQRLIAFALSGLSTSCGPGKSETTTSGIPTTTAETATDTTDPSESGDEDGMSTSPSACLTLDIGLPSGDEESGSEESGSQESGSEDSGSQESGSEESGSEESGGEMTTEGPKLDLPPGDEMGDEMGDETDSGTTGPRPCLAPPPAIPD